MNTTMMTVSGNLVSDVEFRTTSRGDGMARFRLASTATRYDRASARWVDGETTYWNVTAWRRAAENARDSLAKGHPVVVHARVRQRTAEREVPGGSGAKLPVTYTDLEALHFGLDLSRCRAAFQRAPIGPQTVDEATAPAGHEAASGSGPDPQSGPGTQTGPDPRSGSGTQAGAGEQVPAA